ncbi:sensor histidine kinase [Blautia marasmi]|uniref:sensor histidine kinase n=1 Tax=Blautia marasmi TaxID=1917868 RepID=UPI00266B4702|nr:histidine kinase [Blautia marasmi]
MKEKKKFSIQWRVIAIALGCWMIPFVLMVGMMVHYILSNQMGDRVDNMTDQVNFNMQTSVERLNQAIEDSRDASYEGELRSVYEAYKSNDYKDYWLSGRVRGYLNTKYTNDPSFSSTIFWYREAPEKLNGEVYNSSAGGAYHQINTYWEYDHEAVREYAETLDTGIGFLDRDGRIYMIRNLVNRSFEPVGVLVMRLNTAYCFEGMRHFLNNFDMGIYLNDLCLEFTQDGEQENKEGMRPEEYPQGSTWEGGYLYIRNLVKENSYRLDTLVRIPKTVVMDSMYAYMRILGVMIVLLVPLVVFLIFMVRRHILQPTEQLMEGAREIQEGNLGYQITFEAGSQEFVYLTESFNQMSSRLKYQFDHIFQEEMALKDARIMALQSHINPHFMNNTLEIINWEARLSGNMKISKMIESLSVLMNAAMDRKRRHVVPLKEELQYVEAYLHIMKERLGSKLTVEMDISEETLNEKVPRLILQPVIENAIEHGVIRSGSGTVVLRSYKKGDYLYLETENNGIMNEQERAKVDRLLAPDYDTSKESSGNLGIANVNQRLGILYGEPCGLSIFQEKDDRICARLTIFVGLRAQ